MQLTNKLAGSVAAAAALFTLSLFPTGSLAQETPAGRRDTVEPLQNPTPGTVEPPQNIASRGADPRVAILVKERGVSKGDAEAQLALTDKFEKQIEALSSDFSGHYLTSIIEYGRPLSITVVLDRDVDLNEVRQSLSADLRQYIRVKRSRLERQAITDTKRALIDQLSPHYEALTVSFDYPSDRFVAYLPDDADFEEAKKLIDPELRPFVTVKKGAGRSLKGFATNADDPTASDKTAVWGGWPIWVNTAPACTGGFIGKDTLSKEFVMITAGHCPNTNARLRWPTDGTFKPLTDAMGENLGGWYDMQVHWGAWLSSSGYFWVDNDVTGNYRYNCTLQGTNCQQGTFRNLYTGVNTTGYVAVVDAVKGTSWSSWGYNDNHPIGVYRCKYGMVTGVSCGTISDPEVTTTVHGDDGDYQKENFVRITMSSNFQASLMKGDSGGPVFSITTASSTYPQAIAAGITSSGNIKSTGVLRQYRPCVPSLDGPCYIDYMPIDRINDAYPYAIASSSNVDIDVN